MTGTRVLGSRLRTGPKLTGDTEAHGQLFKGGWKKCQSLLGAAAYCGAKWPGGGKELARQLDLRCLQDHP